MSGLDSNKRIRPPFEKIRMNDFFGDAQNLTAYPLISKLQAWEVAETTGRSASRVTRGDEKVSLILINR